MSTKKSQHLQTLKILCRDRPPATMPSWHCSRKAASLDSAKAYLSCISRHGIIASKDLCSQCRGECRVSILRLPNIANLCTICTVELYHAIFHSPPSNIIKLFLTNLDAGVVYHYHHLVAKVKPSVRKMPTQITCAMWRSPMAIHLPHPP